MLSGYESTVIIVQKILCYFISIITVVVKVDRRFICNSLLLKYIDSCAFDHPSPVVLLCAFVLHKTTGESKKCLSSDIVCK